MIYCQTFSVRCPGHTIQFLNYGYSQYIKKVLVGVLAYGHQALNISKNFIKEKDYILKVIQFIYKNKTL